MELPDVSAALLRTAGDDFARALQKRLIALADATDDEAYASRLRLIASGKRPLRTLLHDPRWRESIDPRLPDPAELPAVDPDQRRALDEAAEQARRRLRTPTRDEVASDFADLMRRAAATADAIRDDARGGWDVVHHTGDDPDESAMGTR